MKILAIADKESKKYWDFFERGMLDDIDLIISCGDLDPRYLSFLVTFAHCPLIYVRGNHDDKYVDIPPDGCECIEDSIYEYKGVRFLGLGGSIRYKVGINQYDQKEMTKRVKKLRFKLRKSKGFDVLVTHSPAFGEGDGDDHPHKGFEAFLPLIEQYRPKYFLHGHVHQSYGRKYRRHRVINDTLVINAYETYIFELETEYDEQFEKVKIQQAKFDEEEKRMAEIKKQKLAALEAKKAEEEARAAEEAALAKSLEEQADIIGGNEICPGNEI